MKGGKRNGTRMEGEEKEKEMERREEKGGGERKR